MACNQAYGTLVGIDSGDPHYPYADSYPETTHSLIQRESGTAFARYFCEMNIPSAASDAGARLCVDKIRTTGFEASGQCVRNRYLFPEGPLYYNAPRPDSQGNTSCLRCHVDKHPAPSLSLSALYPGTGPEEQDPRRQPMQWPRELFGNIPASHVGNAPPQPQLGLALDEILMPRYVEP
jgi:hypothetical protein